MTLTASVHPSHTRTIVFTDNVDNIKPVNHDRGGNHVNTNDGRGNQIDYLFRRKSNVPSPRKCIFIDNWLGTKSAPRLSTSGKKHSGTNIIGHHNTREQMANGSKSTSTAIHSGHRVVSNGVMESLESSTISRKSNRYQTILSPRQYPIESSNHKINRNLPLDRRNGSKNSVNGLKFGTRSEFLNGFDLPIVKQQPPQTACTRKKDDDYYNCDVIDLSLLRDSDHDESNSTCNSGSRKHTMTDRHSPCLSLTSKHYPSKKKRKKKNDIDDTVQELRRHVQQLCTEVLIENCNVRRQAVVVKYVDTRKTVIVDVTNSKSSNNLEGLDCQFQCDRPTQTVTPSKRFDSSMEEMADSKSIYEQQLGQKNNRRTQNRKSNSSITYQNNNECSMASTATTKTGTARRNQSIAADVVTKRSVASTAIGTDSIRMIDPVYAIEDDTRSSKSYTLDEFMKMLTSAQSDMGYTLDELEESSGIRTANNKLDANDSINQEKAQYGRIHCETTDYLFKNIWNLQPNDMFVDIGHGVGIVALQAAYTIGCESRGIEVVGARNVIAESILASVDAIKNVHCNVFEHNFTVGNVEFRQGRLEDPNHQAFLISPPAFDTSIADGEYRGATKALVNNFNGVFAERSAKPGQTTYLDHYIAAMFALMVPGSILVTLHPLVLPPPLQVVDENRRRHGLTTGDSNASFYEVSKISLGEARNQVSWAGSSCTTNLFVYKYTRLEQNSTTPVFLCSNPLCTNATNNVPNAATTTFTNPEGEAGIIIDACCHNCNFTQKNLRMRGSVYYGAM
jgi:Histone methylation protein DOT1